MLILRIIAAILLPPLAVIDKGLAPVLITLLLTLLGWIPGVIAAFYFIFSSQSTAAV